MLETKEQETLDFEYANQLPEEATKYHKRIDDLIEDAEIEAEMEVEKKIRSKNSRMLSISMIGIALLALIYYQVNNLTDFPTIEISKETLKKKSKVAEELLTKQTPLIVKESSDPGITVTQSIESTKPIENPFIIKPKDNISSLPSRISNPKKTIPEKQISTSHKLKPSTNKNLPIKEDRKASFYIQAGAFGVKRNAEFLLKNIKEKGFSPSIKTRVQKSNKHILTVGKFTSTKDGDKILKKLSEKGINASIYKNASNSYSLKVGQFDNLKDTQKAQSNLKLKGFLSRSHKEDDLIKTYIVQLGVFPNLEKARLTKEKLAREGFSKTFLR